jgi:hypothetical protein
MRVSGRNVLNFAEGFGAFRLPDLRFTISSREIRPEFDILVYLKTFYIYVLIIQ